MDKFVAVFVRRPVFATVVILSLVVVGAFSYFQLGVDRFPKVDLPWVTVTTQLPGAAPEEVETQITDKIEEAVNTVSGIDELISISSEGVSQLMVSFELEKNPDVAAQEARDRVNGILDRLPQDAKAPVIAKLDPDSQPVVVLSVSAPAGVSPREISEYADKTLRRRLEVVNGVGQVLLVGQRLRQVNVIPDTTRLAALGLTPVDLIAALQSQNVQIPGGRVEQTRRDVALRTYGRVASPAAFGDLPIASRQGYTVRVRDVARVEDGEEVPDSVANVNGKSAVLLLVRKQSGQNTVQIVERVRERVAALRPELPEGWGLDLVRDDSRFITAAVKTVQEHLMVGSLLAALVVWLFLRRFRPTLIAAIAIPSSIIAAFGAMAYMGFTLNILTLLALTLAVGIVIDDAVVVLENIFRFMEEKGMTPRQAAVEGTKEVALAVTATSLSLIAVFLPVAFMGGIVGKFMNSFGVTMAFSILVSLLVSFVLTPMLSSRWLKRAEPKKTEAANGKKASSRQLGFYARIERFYLRLLDWSMAHRWAVVLIVIGVFLSTVPLFMAVDKNFLPFEDEAQFKVAVRAPEGTNLATTQQILESIADKIRQIPGVDNTVLTLGDDPQKTRNRGSIYVGLVPADKRKAGQFEIMESVRRDVLPAYQSLNLRPQVALIDAFGGGVQADVMFWVGGPDFAKLDEITQKLVADLKTMPGVRDLDTNYIVGKPELAVRIDREKAADLGVRVQDIALTLNSLVGGGQVTSYYEGGEEYEVHLRAEAADRGDSANLGRIEIPSAKLGTVRLADLVTLDEGTGPSLVNRLNRKRQIMILANIQPGASAQDVIDRLQNGAKAMHLPAAYSYGLTGQSREQGKAAVNFVLAFVLSFVFMYLILAAQFESWIHPITILLSLPLTIPFALLSILLFNQSLNIFTSLGILVLFGIVKKNSILQIDHTNQLRTAGLPRAEAIREANRDRLRPILMTTLAFVAGMLPLVWSQGTGAGTNRAIGSVIIGGQTLALLLTLIGTPVAYSLFDDVAEAHLPSRLWNRLRGRRGAADETLPGVSAGGA